MTSRTEAGENELLYEADNGIGILTLNRPQRRNALTFAMYDQIKQICARAGTDDDPDKLRVIIFKGLAMQLLLPVQIYHNLKPFQAEMMQSPMSR